MSINRNTIIIIHINLECDKSMINHSGIHHKSIRKSTFAKLQNVELQCHFTTKTEIS